MTTPAQRLYALADAEATRLEEAGVAAARSAEIRKQNDFMNRASAKVSAVLGEEAASELLLVFRGPDGLALLATADLGNGFELRYWDVGPSGANSLVLYRRCPTCGKKREGQVSGLASLAHLFDELGIASAAESALAAQDDKVIVDWDASDNDPNAIGFDDLAGGA